MDSNLWYRNTEARDFRSIPGIAGGSTTGEAEVGGGLHRVRHLNALSTNIPSLCLSLKSRGTCLLLAFGISYESS